MTIERMFNNGMLTRRSMMFVFDEGCLLYEGTLGSAPLNILSSEIADVNIRYKNRVPVELIIRLVHTENEETTIRRMYQKIIYQGTYFTLIDEGTTVYSGYYQDLPKYYLDCPVRKYSWVVGSSSELIIRI